MGSYAGYRKLADRGKLITGLEASSLMERSLPEQKTDSDKEVRHLFNEKAATWNSKNTNPAVPYISSYRLLQNFVVHEAFPKTTKCST